MALAKEALVEELTGVSASVAVDGATVPGRLLVSGVGVDKDAGSDPDPSTGWTLVAVDHSASVSTGLAVRVADGSADDECSWGWTSTRGYSVWIAEADDWEGLASLADLDIQVSEHFTTESVVTSLAMGPITAGGDGLAITHLAIDTDSGWSGDSYTNSFLELLDIGTDPGVEVRQKQVSASESVATTSTTTTGSGDQVSGVLVVFSQPPAVTAWCGGVTDTEATVVHRVPDVGSTARLVVSTSSDLSSPTYSDPVTVDAQGVARLTVDGLAADTGYFFGVEVDSVVLDDGRGEFTTMAAAAATFAFACGSCWNPGGGDTATWGRIAASPARFMIELGDFGYPDEFDGLSVGGLRQNYDKIGTEPGLADLMAAIPWAYTFCDHDSGGEGAWSGSTDLPNAQQVYRERVAHYPLPDEDGIYQTFTCGRARFVLLDTRSFRDEHTDTDDASKTMLGAEQIAWLEGVLEADTSRVIFLVSSVPWNDPTTGSGDGDGWGRYNTERTALISMFSSVGALDRLYIICGDAHMVAADDGTNSPGGIPTVQAAPLGHEPSTKGGTFSEGSEEGTQQYGLITVTDPGGNGEVTVDFEGHDDDDEIAIAMETVFSSPDPSEGEGSIGGVGELVGVGESPTVGPPEGSGSVVGVGELTGVGEAPAVPPAEGQGSLDGVGGLQGVGESPAVPAAEGMGSILEVGQLLGVGETPEVVTPAEGTGSLEGIGRLAGVGEAPIPPLHVFRRPTQTPGVPFVRLQALDGMWETVGADRLRGVRAEGLTATATRWGSDTCRFTLKRNPGGVFPDLTAFTPIEIYNQYGTLVWTGRIKETPSSSGDEFAIGVEGQGWHYHLDDDVYERTYVHARLTDWKDMRSTITANLASFTAAGRVDTGDGAVVIGWPHGAPVAGNVHVGVTLDLGPDSTAKRVVVKTEAVNANAFATFRVRGHDQPMWGDVEDIVTVNFASLTDGYRSGTFTTPHRYVTIFLHRSDGSSGDVGGDHLVRLSEIKVFRDPAYESGNASILTARDIVRDAVQFAPLFSQDLSLIDPDDTISFPIPDFAMTDDRKPREAMEAANALHNYTLKVMVDGRVKFVPLPDKPMFRAGAWSGADFKDASKNSGDEIFNRALVKGTGADGGPVKVDRYASQQPGVAYDRVASPAFANPSFDTNTTGWTSATGSLSRTTTSGEFETSPAGLKWTLGDYDRLTGTLTGTFVKGTAYVVDFAVRHNAGSGSAPAGVFFGNGADRVLQEFMVGGTFTSIRVVWLPRATHSGATFELPVEGALSGFSLSVFVDSCVLSVARPTLPDRRGFTKAHVHSMSQAIVSETGQQIADTFLQTHKRTPLKGDITIKGRHGLRRMQGDATVPPSELLLHTGELVHLSDQIDPDTGALGRDAPIDTVTWNADEDSASVSLDAQRDNLAALLSRYDLVAGSGG